ncbi:hypothetical protein [Mycoplasma todarodis]|uniref:hypothetical protein n=1 Tax=Mycoplasma todarodis TaxID=1937191 RepID=UPI003B2A8F08
MKKKLDLTEEISVDKDARNKQNKKRIRRLIFSVIIIAITAGAVVGVSFAIAIVNKHKEKTGELETNASYSSTIKIENIYK